MSVVRMIYWLGALLVGLWLAGFLWFTGTVASLTPPSEPRAAAIVVLTGGGGRVEEGLKLLQAGAGKKLLVSGVHPDVDRADFLSAYQGRVQLDPKLVDCCVTLGYVAGTTEGNAAETANWARDQKLSSLIVVTANYHLPRALLEFHRALPRLELVPYPLPRATVAVGNWWESEGTAHLLLVEYAKYTAALARAAIDLFTGGNNV